MDFGINLATAADSWKVVKRAEDLGYARAWFYDTQLLNADMFVAMGAAAVQTSRIRLGTGVLIPSTLVPWILYLPLALGTFLFGQTPWLATAFEHMQFARPVHMILGSVAVFVLVIAFLQFRPNGLVALKGRR